LRQKAPATPIAFFLHTPFPGAAEFAAVPNHDQLVAGMLGADVLGFHTAQYAENFLELARRLGYSTDGQGVRVDSRVVDVKTRPMGIDAGSFSGLASEARVREKAVRLRESTGALLLGVDRLDYTKGILQRLLAFECLLERHAELNGRTTLMQIAVPTREDLAVYRDLRQMVEAIVARINRNFGSPGWQPVKYVYGSVDLETLVSLYCAADVMLVTSQRDGLNLVAKEFIASRTDGDGVLILSRFAGAAEELAAALQVNPNRISELADSYYSALKMPPEERNYRMRQLRRAVKSNDVFHWAAEFIDNVMEPVAQALGA
jgi:trehalose 6-phosphate synthase/phosphatase